MGEGGRGGRGRVVVEEMGRKQPGAWGWAVREWVPSMVVSGEW